MLASPSSETLWASELTRLNQQSWLTTDQMKTVSKKYLLKVLLLLVKMCHLHIFFPFGAENISVLQILNHLQWRIWLKPDTEPDTTERLALTGFTCRFPQDRRTRAASIV